MKRFIPFLSFMALSLLWAGCNDTAWVGDLEELSGSSKEGSGAAAGLSHRYVLKAEPGRERFKKASALNDRGMALYDKGRYPEAADLFRQAIVEDSLYLYPHYNLACCLSLLYGQGDLSVGQELFDELALCLGLDGSIRDKMATDTDLDAARENEKFAALMEGGPVIPPAEELWAGEWHSFYSGGEGTLILNPDKTFLFTTRTGDSQAAETAGVWQLSNVDSRLVFTPEGSFLFCGYDPADQITPLKKAAVAVEQDQSAFEIRFYDSADGRRPLAVFTREESPLLRALSVPDPGKAALFLKAGFMPNRSNYQGQSPFLLALESQRPALIRLFMGYKGILPGFGEYLYMTGSPDYENRYRGYLERTADELMAETSAAARFERKRYRDLLSESLVSPETAVEPEIGLGWGSSNRLYFLGSSGTAVAFLESNYSSAMPGTIWSVRVFNAAENRVADQVTIGIESPMGEEGPPLFLNGEDAVVWMLMDSEWEWVPLLEKHGIKSIQASPRIRPLPIRLGGESVDIRISSTLSDEDSGIIGDMFTWEILRGGSSVLSPESPFPAYSVTPLGCFSLKGDLPAAVIFIHITSWGFEGETDSYIEVIGVAEVK
jgi:hypothetical protein